MPSSRAVPTVAALLTAGKNAVRGICDGRADTRAGSAVELLLGPSAILLSRAVLRDRDMFRARYFDTASGDDLTAYARDHFGAARTLDTKGAGAITVTRPTAGAGAGTFWRGSRIVVGGAFKERRLYSVTADTAVSASALSAQVPIEAVDVGAPPIAATSGASFDDPAWDATWTIGAITCAPGTTFEEASAFRARVRKQRQDERKGYATRIARACKDAGATEVVLFASDYSGDATDVGLSACYVSGPTGVATACELALEDYRNLGCDLWVGGITTASVDVTVTIALWQDPARLAAQTVTTLATGAIVEFFADPTNAFAYKRDAFAGAVARTHTAIQTVTVTVPASDAVLSAAAWPATLTRYTLGAMRLTITGPT